MTQMLMQDDSPRFNNLRKLFGDWHANDQKLDRIRQDREPTPEEIDEYETVRFNLEEEIKSFASDDRTEYIERIKKELDHLKK